MRTYKLFLEDVISNFNIIIKITSPCPCGHPSPCQGEGKDLSFLPLLNKEREKNYDLSSLSLIRRGKEGEVKSNNKAEKI